MKVSIIGAGKMGLWFAAYLLKKGFEVILSDSDKQKIKRIKTGELPIDRYLKSKQLITSTNINAVKKAETIILAIPLKAMDGLLSEIGEFINDDKLIIDTSSIRHKAKKY